MTFREAMRTALRELGYSDAEIDERFRYSDREFGCPQVDAPMRLKDGHTERDVIESIKRAESEVRAMSEEKKQEISDWIAWEIEQDNRKN